MREVEIIAPKKYRKIRLLNVAAYARVSDAKDTMLNSLAAQVAYYTTYIVNRQILFPRKALFQSNKIKMLLKQPALFSGRLF